MGSARSFSEWIDRGRGAPAGVFFFDTVDGQPPRPAGDSAPDGTDSNLAGLTTWDGGAWAGGLILLHAERLVGPSSGTGALVHVPMPGEPFLKLIARWHALRVAQSSIQLF